MPHCSFVSSPLVSGHVSPVHHRRHPPPPVVVASSSTYQRQDLGSSSSAAFAQWSVTNRNGTIAKVEANVPGNIYMDLLAAGVMQGDPYYRDNEAYFQCQSRESARCAIV